MNKDNLAWLQQWYQSQCDGDWEHEYGIVIETVDNPGWYLTINLIGTERENKPFQYTKKEINESDWYFCVVRNNNFEASCSPTNLETILQIFRDWVENSSTE